MSIVMKSILNRKYNHVRTAVLRLYEKSKHTNRLNYACQKRMLVTFQTFPERHKYPFFYRQCSVDAISDTYDSPEENEIRRDTHEHALLYAMLENSVHYQNSIMQPIKVRLDVCNEDMETLSLMDWSSLSKDEIYNAIKKMSYCHLNNMHFQTVVYDDMLQAFITAIPEYSNKQLQKLLQHIMVFSNELKLSRIYQIFTKALSKECLRRFFGANIEELFLMVDVFYHLDAFKCDYTWRTLRKLGSKIHKFTAKNLVQFMFYLSMYQSCDVNMYEVECRVEECLSEVSVNELAIIARGFFLNQKRIHSKKLVEKFLIKLTTDIKTVDGVCLGTIMKALRYSDCCHCLSMVRNLLESIREEVPRLPLMNLIHVAHAVGSIRVYDKILLDKILQRMENEIKSTRLKDIERVMYTVCTISPYTEYTSECNKLITEIQETYKTKRADELRMFPASLARILMFITYKKIYPEELWICVMRPTFIQQIYKNRISLLTNELWALHNSIQIEVPNYKGELLKPALHNRLIKKYYNRDDVYRRDKGVKLRIEIAYFCKDQLGLDVYTDCILPHFFTVDIVLGFDEHNKSVPVEPILAAMPMGSVKRVDNLPDDQKKIKWKVLLILSQMQKVIGHDGYIGPMYAKFRQLQAIGYTPIPVTELSWGVLQTDEKKSSYLKQLIYDDSDTVDVLQKMPV